MEIAIYKALVAAAESVGDLARSKEVCQQILTEEQELAAWLDENLPGITRAFLARDASATRAGGSLVGAS
ncbi:hypothetical protein CCR97_13825 [Rhodoplanes elegans]|uniref:Uncharacterized protein n=1 Tax=Rhodoplanes elegans TaxID=29408 RepID=A0A327KV93_9BRAD|nr:DUF892 family protein [Rhodoplanes elegans]MBK5959276.1 hypothetical protein [Rhodoplanes elegans]RAI42201.1 hypothetical protein CH338_00815 [Rhodoplanes elegans]